MPWNWWMELVIDDDRVEGIFNEACLDGVVLRDVLPKVDALLRSLTLRDSEGNRVSILVLMMLFSAGWACDGSLLSVNLAAGCLQCLASEMR